MSSPSRIIELHLALSVVSRAKGASCVAKAAYNHRQKFTDERTGTRHNYRRRGVDVTKFMRGFGGTPEQLWNEVERTESQLAFKKHAAQTAYSFHVGLPRELGRSDSLKAFVGLCTWLHASFGVVVDGVVHWDENNPHGHVMFTQRTYDAKARKWSRKKVRDFVALSGGDGLKRLRAEAARIFNDALAVVSGARVEHASLASRGIMRAPTQHEGARARYLRTRLGVATDIHQQNQAATTAALPTRTRKPPMKTKPATPKPTDTPVEVRDFWRDTARALLAAATHLKRPDELTDEDFQVIHDKTEGHIAVAVCVDSDGERHFAIKPVIDGQNPFAGRHRFVHECAIPAPEATSADIQQTRSR